MKVFDVGGAFVSPIIVLAAAGNNREANTSCRLTRSVDDIYGD